MDGSVDGETTRAPGSGCRNALAEATAVDGTAAAGVQVWKSCVWKILPERVRAKSEPSGENQTSWTGPVAGDASIRSTEGLPMRRQSVCCAAATATAASASASNLRPFRNVPL